MSAFSLADKFRSARRHAGCLLAAAALLVLAEAAAGEDRPAPTVVDLQLVIASDVSTSMDAEEKQLQLQGFVAAFRDSEVVRAVMRGPRRRIAATYIEWGGEGRQRIVVPWSLIDGPDTAAAFADRLAATYPGRLVFGTAMGEALLFGAGLFPTSGFASERRVIDISGDGKSNKGPPLELARALVLSRDITINGLPIVYDQTWSVGGGNEDFAADDLTEYFLTQVVGGPDAFVVPVSDPEVYRYAIRQKLIREIAGGPQSGEARFSRLP